jgi:hypothetical protein
MSNDEGLPNLEPVVQLYSSFEHWWLFGHLSLLIVIVDLAQTSAWA